MPPQAQEGRASIPRVPNDKGNNERRKRRRLSGTAIATGGTASKPQAYCRRRRDADDRKDYRPGTHSDVERSEDDNVVIRSPRHKRSKAIVTTVSTASRRQTRPNCGDSSSREARRCRTVGGIKPQLSWRISTPLFHLRDLAQSERSSDQQQEQPSEPYQFGDILAQFSSAPFPAQWFNRRLSRRPRRRRGTGHPPSSRDSTLERGTETDRTPAAMFEE